MALENYMGHDEIAEGFEMYLKHLHAAIDARPSGSLKRRLNRLAQAAHLALEQLHEEAHNAGLVTFGGTDKPEPGQ